ncbi:hypothetical protein CSB11_00620 [Candidatus Campbellbacteria bacterium]|nr:MAG: hypothetical protein CSB11_00620 [Candidatus Campbellbacteria bacterium]
MNTQEIKDFLEMEKKELLEEIGKIGVASKGAEGGFDPKETNTHEGDVLDQADLADEMTNISTNNAILNELEIRLKEVNDSLDDIENGKYGICQTCGKEIEEKRILANKTAKHCIEHMDLSV